METLTRLVQLKNPVKTHPVERSDDNVVIFVIKTMFKSRRPSSAPPYIFVNILHQFDLFFSRFDVFFDWFYHFGSINLVVFNISDLEAFPKSTFRDIFYDLKSGLPISYIILSKTSYGRPDMRSWPPLVVGIWFGHTGISNFVFLRLVKSSLPCDVLLYLCLWIFLGRLLD